MRSKLIFVVPLVVLLMLACSLAGNGGSSPNQTTPDPLPVSLNEGLASLNSYDMTVRFSSSGPDPAQSSTTRIQRLRSNDANASATTIDVVVVGADGGDPEDTGSSIYQIGNDQCSGSEADGWTWTSSTPAEAEMQGLVSSMIGLTPLIDNPVFVAAETVNGIPTNHFAFRVSGLGATSGAVVSVNQGDYWLAVDGRYLVKYILIIETSSAPGIDVLHEEIMIELNQINQPVNIAFPQGCLEASPSP